MTKIIIDGVDVSECEKLGETIDGITCGLGKRIRFANEIITKHNLCEDNPNCYFKQLKRLEQENDKYRSALEEILESAKFAQCVPCGYISDCDNCDDEITNNGQFCMHKRIEEIKAKTNEVLS